MAHFGSSLVGALLEGVTLVGKPMLVGIPSSVSFQRISACSILYKLCKSGHSNTVVLILRRRPMMGVDLGLGRGHHNVICGEQRLYQHIILLSTHYLYQHIILLLTHSSYIIQSLEMSSKSEPFSETLLELFYISA